MCLCVSHAVWHRCCHRSIDGILIGAFRMRSINHCLSLLSQFITNDNWNTRIYSFLRLIPDKSLIKLFFGLHIAVNCLQISMEKISQIFAKALRSHCPIYMTNSTPFSSSSRGLLANNKNSRIIKIICFSSTVGSDGFQYACNFAPSNAVYWFANVATRSMD